MSKNISKEKREKLVKEICEIKKYVESAQQDENTKNLLEYISNIEKELRSKKYGLVFEEHRENIDEVLEQSVPYLVEDKDLFVDNGGQMNFLIEGDNLASLKLLEKTHKGKIDLIYIDPPYNTGNKDFVYDDNFVGSDDDYKHSKWLSFMETRLSIAFRLLSIKGAIMISIDERELFNLKLLCDSVFGEENYISCLSCQSNPGGNKSDFIESTLQYVLVYSKQRKSISDFGFTTTINEGDYPLEDEKGKYKKGGQLEKWGNDDTTHTHPNLAYSIYYNPKSNDVKCLFDYNKKEISENRNLNIQYLTPNPSLIEQGYFCIRPRKTNAGENGRWRMEVDTFLARFLNIGFIFQKTRDQYKIYEKIRLVPNKFIKAKNFIPAQIAKQESKEILSIFGHKVFDYPKPLNLMMYLVDVYNNSSATILDFFAGSGTTGHAVMKLNAQDGGTRKFILCTNNENNICRDITYERIKRVIERDNFSASLKYMRVRFLPISEKVYYEYADFLLKHVKELVELENAIDFDHNAEIAIVLTDEELDEFMANLPTTCKTIYLGHDVLPTEEQEKILLSKEIKVNIIPNYYYRELEG